MNFPTQEQMLLLPLAPMLAERAQLEEEEHLVRVLPEGRRRTLSLRVRPQLE